MRDIFFRKLVYESNYLHTYKIIVFVPSFYGQKIIDFLKKKIQIFILFQTNIARLLFLINFPSKSSPKIFSIKLSPPKLKLTIVNNYLHTEILIRKVKYLIIYREYNFSSPTDKLFWYLSKG